MVSSVLQWHSAIKRRIGMGWDEGTQGSRSVSRDLAWHKDGLGEGTGSSWHLGAERGGSGAQRDPWGHQGAYQVCGECLFGGVWVAPHWLGKEELQLHLLQPLQQLCHLQRDVLHLDTPQGLSSVPWWHHAGLSIMLGSVPWWHHCWLSAAVGSVPWLAQHK